MMAGGEWFDEEAGPLVRPYALTRGRTRTGRHDLNMITLVVTVRPDADAAFLVEPEYAEILRLCQMPLSVAEIAAKLNLPMAVVKVLLVDLIEQNLVVFRSPPPRTSTPDRKLLQAVLDGIRRL
ncbi:MAG TPA: DUF742 domain-containing protein [Amycolatopsis sp.]|jgi:hypothetical protein|nr:DUF742 domain-containing protein [Amycolatopsis sp.]